MLLTENPSRMVHVLCPHWLTSADGIGADKPSYTTAKQLGPLRLSVL